MYRKFFKRILDILLSLIGLVLTLPFCLPIIFLVWRHDYKNPFYIPKRIGKHGKPFKMLKVRTMEVDADKTEIDSTAANDPRITPIGHFIRKYKIDEIFQLWNVLIGHMSLVGPRPNVERETNIYTIEERHLLDIAPGITDISSIVFSDLAEIICNAEDANIAYNQLVRPWKSRLGLFYIKHSSIMLDIKIILCTILSIVNREQALLQLSNILKQLGANDELVIVAKRQYELTPCAPPGADHIVESR